MISDMHVKADSEEEIKSKVGLTIPEDMKDKVFADRNYIIKVKDGVFLVS